MKLDIHSYALFTIADDGQFLALSTYTPSHGRSSRFFVFKSSISKWLAGEDTSFMDTDCGSFVRFTRESSEKIFVEFTWLSDSMNNLVRGYRQRFTVPVQMFLEVLNGQKKAKLLVSTEASMAHSTLCFSRDAHAQAHKICANKAKRRALMKALRDGFHWGNCTVSLYCDYECGFYFSENKSPDVPWSLNGGLVLHDTTIVGKDGQPHEKLYYSLYT